MALRGNDTPQTEVGNVTYLRSLSQEDSFEAPQFTRGDLSNHIRNRKAASGPHVRPVFSDMTNRPAHPFGEFTPMLKSVARPNATRPIPSIRRPSARSPGKQISGHVALRGTPRLPTGTPRVYEDATGSSREIGARFSASQSGRRRSLGSSTPLQKIADESVVHVDEEHKLTLKDQENVRSVGFAL